MSFENPYSIDQDYNATSGDFAAKATRWLRSFNESYQNWRMEAWM